MGSKRYEKYSDPLTPIQKRELKHKEHKPDGEKRHLQIISYSNEKLVDVLCLDSYSIFEKSIAKEEILRRLQREKKRRDNHKPKPKKQNNNRKTKNDKWKRFEQVAPKTGIHVGIEHKEKYEEFISDGGDPDSCPFD